MDNKKLKHVKVNSLRELKSGLLSGGFETISTSHLLVAFGGDETNNCEGGNCVAGCGATNTVAGCGGTVNKIAGCGVKEEV